MLQTLLRLSLVCTLICSSVKASKICKDYTFSLNITSGNYLWGLPVNKDNFDITTFTTNLARWDANVTLDPISGYTPAANSQYKISGSFCHPINGGSGTVLVATHGFGFDRGYWDPDIQPDKYSFVDFAISKGHSVFFYDRLGLSKSTVVSGYINQVSIQVAILEQLVGILRSGRFCAVPKAVVLVGHSFGSVVSNALLVASPGLVDGAVLTGIGYKVPDTSVAFEAWQPRLASLQSPAKWRQLDGGYVTWVDIFANVNTFFKAPFYDPRVVQYAEDNKQPFSLMEVITLSITDLHSPKFVGPVLVISGESDLVFCNGNCVPLLEPDAKPYFPASKDLKVYVHPGSGHGINLSLNATGAFGVMTDFLAKNGF